MYPFYLKHLVSLFRQQKVAQVADVHIDYLMHQWLVELGQLLHQTKNLHRNKKMFVV